MRMDFYFCDRAFELWIFEDRLLGNYIVCRPGPGKQVFHSNEVELTQCYAILSAHCQHLENLTFYS